MNAAAVTHVYEDRFGEVIDHADDGFLEIRWYDATEGMSSGDFQNWLTAFAGEVERRHRPGILVDSTRFLMARGDESEDWWSEHIAPRYNAAGVERFAFHVPDGTPDVGAPPTSLGPATFETAYFARREDALDWLKT